MKTLLINGSPNELGSTGTALRFAADAIEDAGIETEMYHIPKAPVSGCVSCGACIRNRNGRCAFDNDAVNIILEKMETADALIIGSPVYYASPNGQLLSVLDRVFFAGSSRGRELFQGKPGSAICAARRGGAASTLDALQKYFTISGMPIAPSNYWPMIYGQSAEEVRQDGEGVQIMGMVGKTIAWLLKCIEAGERAGASYPEPPGGKKVWTNFIR